MAVKWFRVAGTFEAADIDDALAKLAQHFRALTDDELTDGLLGRCDLRVEPLPEPFNREGVPWIGEAEWPA